MKHPLTSKERRGLVAVAAAALLCIGSGFLFRNCSQSPGSRAVASDNVVISCDSLPADSAVCKSEGQVDSVSSNNGKSGKKKRRGKADTRDRVAKKKSPRSNRAQKTYPARDPLSQPCD